MVEIVDGEINSPLQGRAESAGEFGLGPRCSDRMGGRPLALNIYGGIPPLAVMNWVLPCPTVPVTGDGGVTVIIGQVAAVTVKFIVAVPPGPPITMPTRPGVAPAGTEVSI